VFRLPRCNKISVDLHGQLSHGVTVAAGNRHSLIQLHPTEDHIAIVCRVSLIQPLGDSRKSPACKAWPANSLSIVSSLQEMT
jgi:hypothetical protein